MKKAGAINSKNKHYEARGNQKEQEEAIRSKNNMRQQEGARRSEGKTNK